MKKCIICGELFTPKSGGQKTCGKQHYRPCPICGKPLPFKRPSDPVKCCSKECSRENTKRKNIEKYGVEHPMQCAEVREHHKKAMMDKYGVESPLQSDEIKQRAIKSNQERFGCNWALESHSIRETSKKVMTERYGAAYTLQSDQLRKKVIDTNIEKYGCENPMQNEEVRKKAEQTCVERYGVSNPMQDTEISAKASQTRINRYGAIWSDSMRRKAIDTWMQNLGVPNPSFSKKVIDRITDTFLSKYGVKRAINVPEFREKMKATNEHLYGVPYYVVSKSYIENGAQIRISNANKRFAQKLDAYHISYTYEYSIGLKSYDICIPTKKILIEIDPTYTHNAIGNHWNSNGLDKYYHLEKTKIARDAGFRCIHLFDWDNPYEILNLLLEKSAIYARKCKIQSITKAEADEFIADFHLQGICRGNQVNYGLYLDGELVQVMTFGTPRYNSHYQWELLRLCTDSRYYVIGGAERMFKHFLSDYKPESIISYCDIAKFSGSVYSRLGFTHLRNTEPAKVWSHGADKITNNLLLQRGFDQLFGTNYGKGTSNEELMLEHGWLPVYDCGQAVYEWKNL